jgi:transposase
MAIVAGFDVHRRQITFDALDAETGEVSRGRIASTRAAVSDWVGRFPEQAVEACTGWLFVCEALAQAGARPHLAEPAETSARRGRKRRAKTDRADACHLRELLCQGRLPESWLPPAHVCEWRTRTRLRKTLVDERTQWLQRIRATLFQHGVPVAEVPERLLSRQGRAFLTRVELPERARERIAVALALIETIEAQLVPLERVLRDLARSQPGCQALMRQFGIGELLAPTILCELGDVSRLSSSRKAVRAVGLDVGVHRSDRRSRVGRLTKQGSSVARWALYEAAQSACGQTSPDHGAYLALKARGLSHTRTSLTIARKLTRRCFHTLRELGPAALDHQRLSDARPADPVRSKSPPADGPHPRGLLPQ